MGEPWPDALEGERWAMVVDLAICREQGDCTECIDACHAIHNVPKIPDERRSIEWIWKMDHESAFPDQENPYLPEEVRHGPALVLCNHCERPPCTRVCPTQATWKRDDGVVMMDMHRCIGCRYCMAACPYGSRSFNWEDPTPYIEKVDPGFPHRMKGVVEKCNLCAERLARGEKPKCVEVCPHGALAFGDVSKPELREKFEGRHVVRRKVHLGTEPNVFYLV
jgi:molybdopterin-containing oxidoreductase family iron-sulfur binding subunit